MRMRPIISLSVACPACLLYFSTLSHKRQDLKKKFLEIKCVLIVSTALSKHFSLYEEFSEILSQMQCVFTYRVPVILVKLQRNLQFSRHTFKKYSNTKFCENPSPGNRVVSCEKTDTQTEITAAFRTSAKTPKDCAFCHIVYLRAVYDAHKTMYYFLNNLNLLVFVMETEWFLWVGNSWTVFLEFKVSSG
jgi:hypothetical protein